MSEYLFIRPSMVAPRSCLWFSYDDQGKNVLASGKVDSLPELKNVSGVSPDRPVIVLYPSASLKFRTVTYPGKLKKHAYSPILYMLEDEFAEDVENFSAHMMAKNGKNYDFLIFRKEEFSEFEKALQALGFTVVGMIPDVICLPAPVKIGDKTSENYKISALSLEGDWLIRDGVNSGVSIPNEWLQDYIETLPENKHLVSLSVVPEGLKEKVQEELIESPLAKLAEGALTSKVNLSTFQKKRNIQFKFLTSWVKVVVACLIFATLWYLNMNSRTSAVFKDTMDYRNQQRSVFSQLMGSNGRVNDPVARMKEILSNASPIGTDEGFLDMLRLISSRLTQSKGIELVNIKFDRSKRLLAIQFLSDGTTDLNNFVSGFSPDFSATVTDSKPSRERTLISVQLRRMK